MSTGIAAFLIIATVVNYYLDWRWKRKVMDRLNDIQDQIDTLKKAA